jgi:hypothetical protein
LKRAERGECRLFFPHIERRSATVIGNRITFAHRGSRQGNGRIRLDCNPAFKLKSLEIGGGTGACKAKSFVGV